MAEGLLTHYGCIRLRVKGSGTLRMRLLSIDEVQTVSLANLTMAAATNREPTTLCNFTQQKAQLEIKTTGINETFIISKVVIYVKPVATGFAG